MKRTYKVWVEIEELDAKGDPTNRTLCLPDSLGSFNSLKKATAKVAEVVNEHGIDPENSDSVKANAAAKTPVGVRARLRLDPGGVVPAGEGPKCGALAYPMRENEGRVVVVVRDGVAEVTQCPEGVEVEVRDYDTDGSVLGMPADDGAVVAIHGKRGG